MVQYSIYYSCISLQIGCFVGGSAVAQVLKLTVSSYLEVLVAIPLGTTY